MNGYRIRVLIVILALAVVPPAVLAGSNGHVNFFLGQKSLDKDDWEPVEDQPEFGAVMSFGQDDWPIHIAVDVLGSADDASMFDPLLGDVDLTAATFEVCVGVRKIWVKNSLHPYVGGGLALVGAAAELDSDFGDEDADDSGVGAWVGGGVFWRLGKRFNIGGDLRWSNAEVDLDFGDGLVTPDLKAGGVHAGLLLGFGW